MSKEKFNLSEFIIDYDGKKAMHILYPVLPQGRVKEWISILKKYNKNKLMGKDFILISIKDFNKLTGDGFK